MADTIQTNKYVSESNLKTYHGLSIQEMDKRDEVAKQAAIDASNAYTDGQVTTLTQTITTLDGNVGKNTSAIEKLNGTETEEGSVKKAVKDAQDALQTNIDAVEKKADGNASEIEALQTKTDETNTKVGEVEAKADKAQSDVDALKTYVGTIPEDAGVTDVIAFVNKKTEGIASSGTVEQIQTDLQGVKTDIDNIKPRVTTVEGKVATLIGEDADKSIRDITLEEVAKIINDNDPTEINTLEEIAAWIKAHPESVAELNALIQANKTAIEKLTTLVGTLPEGEEVQTIVAYVDKKALEAETNAKAHADGLNTAMDTRVKNLETAVGESGSIKTDIEKAKQEAIDASKDHTATEVQKVQASSDAVAGRVTTLEGEMEALEERVDTVESGVTAINTSLAEGGATANAIADAKKAGTDAQASVDTLNEKVVADEARIAANETGVTEAKTSAATNAENITKNADAISGVKERVDALEAVKWEAISDETIKELFA